MATNTTTRAAEEFLTASIDDYLLALADGIYQAQRQLSQVAIDLQPGQPPVTYQLPKVDFEFKMSFELAKKVETQESSSASLSQSGGVLRVRPADTQTTTSGGSRAEVASQIKGSFVAVPARGGKPVPVVRSTVERLTGRRYQLDVFASTTAGEVMSGVEVQFNIDREMSTQLNQANSLNIELKEGSVLSSGVVATNADGHAVNVLTLADEEPAGAYVVVLIDVLDQTEVISFQVEA